MNVLRELRKFKNKSLITRIRITLVLSIMLIASTYAWWNMDRNINANGLEASVNSWDVFYVDNENNILDEEYTLVINEFYPGMSDDLHEIRIKNIGESATEVKVELTSVTMFGEEILPILKTNNEIKEIDKKTYIFTDKTKYPFDIYYQYDDYIKGNKNASFNTNTLKPENLVNYPESVFKLCFSWGYENEYADIGLTGRDVDDLDTEFAKKAYEYYEKIKMEAESEKVETESEGEEQNTNTVDTTKISAIVLKIRITSSFIVDKKDDDVLGSDAEDIEQTDPTQSNPDQTNPDENNSGENS